MRKEQLRCATQARRSWRGRAGAVETEMEASALWAHREHVSH